MLNISKVSIEPYIDKSSYKTFRILERRTVPLTMIRILLILLFAGIPAMFLPWTQTIRTQGYVTTLYPDQRPQAIQSLIDGKIEKWYVHEGESVMKGDTILKLTESNSEYLDPDILDRTDRRRDAKQKSAGAYLAKAENLETQYNALLENKEIRLRQNRIAIDQMKLKMASDSMELEALKIRESNAVNQFDRITELYKKGIKSRTDMEIRENNLREAQAEVVMMQNKLQESLNRIKDLEINQLGIHNDFSEKLASIRSEIMAARSAAYSAIEEVDKLSSDYNKLRVRKEAHYITSPIDGVITKAVQFGVGQFINAGEDLLTIFPTRYEPAVEMYVKPRDMPLIKKGQEVRLQFDGWPAVVFRGWPNNAHGTFAGKVFAIDQFISMNGRYRLLVAQDPEAEPWPEEIKVGGGVNSLILLNDVRLYYEIWRIMNGFPPDYYKAEELQEITPKPKDKI